MAVKSLQQEQLEQRHDREMELAKRELRRKSLDTIRVYNPLDTTFSFMYDRYWHRVPPKKTKDFSRYLAIHYFKLISNKMINDQITLAGNKMIKDWEQQTGKSFAESHTKYAEQVAVWDNVLKVNDLTTLWELRKLVILGVVEEYGAEEPEPEMREPETVQDYRPMAQQVFDDIDNAPLLPPDLPEDLGGTADPEKASGVKPHTTPASKKDLEKEVSNG